jgi:outer membrane protein assembly factor BamB
LRIDIARTFPAWGFAAFLCAALPACGSKEPAVGPAPPAEAISDREIENAAAGADQAPARDLELSAAWTAMNRNWPSFRGPGGLGAARFTNAPVEWDVEAGTNIRWKVAVPRGGTNSPVVWGDRIFLSGADAETREVFCFDADTGDLRWTRTLEPFDNTPPQSPEVSEETSYAASSLAVDGERVFAIFSNGDLAGYGFDGTFLWGRNLGLFDNHYGHSSSLLVFDGSLFVQLDQNSNGRLLAIDVASGDESWSVAREKISWASPIVAPTRFGTQLIVVSEENVDAYDPKTGELLWSQPCLGGEVAPSPAYCDGIVFAANEYAIATAIALKEAGGRIEPSIQWEFDELLPEVSSPVGDGERFYFATSYGELVCLDADTGEAAWMEELSQEGFYSSPVLVGDRIYLLDMAGTMFIVRAAPEYELLASHDMGEQTLATPAFLDGRIYVRTEHNLICIEEQPD